MRKVILLLIMATGFFSCNQGSKLARDIWQRQKPYEKNVDSKYVYTDASGASLIIENSFPKSGIKYIDPNGKNYVYAVFWTRIINETGNPFELNLDFPKTAFELPSSSGNDMQLFLPSDTLTLDKVPLYDYGLAVKRFLDVNILTSTSLKRTIHPKESTGFYVITLANRGVNGTLRTGLSVKGHDLFYRINDKEIWSGKINFEKLTLQK